MLAQIREVLFPSREAHRRKGLKAGGIRASWRTGDHTDFWAPPVEFLSQQGWGVAWEFAFLASSQLLLLLFQRPYSK